MDFSPFCKRLKMTNFPKTHTHPKNKNSPKPPQNPKRTTKIFYLSYWAFARKRSIHKFEVQIYISKYGFFILKFKAYLKFCGFFATLKMTNFPKTHTHPKNKNSPKPPPNHQAPNTPQKFFVCHTELSQESEVSIKSKCDFNVLKCLKFCGYFANAQYDNMDFSLRSKWQISPKFLQTPLQKQNSPKFSPKIQKPQIQKPILWIFRYAQNDNAIVILNFA